MAIRVVCKVAEALGNGGKESVRIEKFLQIFGIETLFHRGIGISEYIKNIFSFMTISRKRSLRFFRKAGSVMALSV